SNPGLPQELRTLINKLGTRMEFARGETLFSAGATEAHMFLVESGSVMLLFEYGWGERALGAGHVFGDLALIFENHTRTATAIAADDLVVTRIGRDQFDRLECEQPKQLLDLFRYTSAYLLSNEIKLGQELKARTRELEQVLDYLHRTKRELSAREVDALTDQVTGIYNRRCFEEHMRAHDEANSDVALLLVDLDYFKQVNDTAGHACGDRVLRTVADTLRASVRDEDLPCRIGGDEFAVLMTDVDTTDALVIARRIQDEIRAMRISAACARQPVTVSMGGACRHSEEPVALLQERTDALLYDAKERGRNRMIWSGTEYA
ncbi:MAG: GGDEF domain-containing protein, partial [Gammaproteobacteria bacterium]